MVTATVRVRWAGASPLARAARRAARARSTQVGVVPVPVYRPGNTSSLPSAPMVMRTDPLG
ncbi:hypothetical protein P3T35_007467 [Kitasatospora sp. GP30]|nr:hypothetical protein [Kitasatospora sp. GP30]